MKTFYDEYMAQRNVMPEDVTDIPAVKGVTAAGVTYDLQKRCMMCGVEIPWRSKRQDAKTCGANCRKAMSRRKEAIKRELDAVNDALRNLVRFSERWPDLLDEISKAGDQASITARRVSLDLLYAKGSAAAHDRDQAKKKPHRRGH